MAFEAATLALDEETDVRKRPGWMRCALMRNCSAYFQVSRKIEVAIIFVANKPYIQCARGIFYRILSVFRHPWRHQESS